MTQSGLALADVKDEALENFTALNGVRDFRDGTGRHRSPFPRQHIPAIGHDGVEAHHFEARRKLGNFVAVAHPNLQHSSSPSSVSEVVDALQEAWCGRARGLRRSRTHA